MLKGQAYQDVDDAKKVKMMELATKRLVSNVRTVMLEKKQIQIERDNLRQQVENK